MCTTPGGRGGAAHQDNRELRERKGANMDFQYTPEQETFRDEVKDWLEANLVPDLCVDDPKDERVAPGNARCMTTDGSG